MRAGTASVRFLSFATYRLAGALSSRPAWPNSVVLRLRTGCCLRLLTAGAIALAAFNPRTYVFAPVVALVMSLAMFGAWGQSTADPLAFGITIVAFGILHCVSGYVLMWRSPIRVVWGVSVAVASLAYYLIAYETLGGLEFGYPIWGAVAFGLALGAASIVAEILQKLRDDDAARSLVLAAFSIAAACFLTLGFATELDRQALQVAVAGEVLAAVWLAGRVPVKTLKPISAVLLTLFGLLVLPELGLLIQLAMIPSRGSFVFEDAPAIDWPILQFGIPALTFVGASLMLRRQNDEQFAKVLESATAVLFGAAIYCVTRQVFHPEGHALLAEPSELERSVTTNVSFLSGLAALWLGYRYRRDVAVCAALAFAIAASFRLLPELAISCSNSRCSTLPPDGRLVRRLIGRFSSSACRPSCCSPRACCRTDRRNTSAPCRVSRGLRRCSRAR